MEEETGAGSREKGADKDGERFLHEYTLEDDPELDSVGVDIEMTEDAVDSDTFYITEGAYALVNEEFVEIKQKPNRTSHRSGIGEHPDCEPHTRATDELTTEKRLTVTEDHLRKKKNLQFLKQDKELHLLKKEEQLLKSISDIYTRSLQGSGREDTKVVPKGR